MPQPPVTRFTSARQLAVRAELETTRTNFHALLADLSENQWRQQCPHSAWTVGETVSHIVGSMGVFAGQIVQVRKGRGIPRMLPAFIVNRINTSMTRRGAMTKHSCSWHSNTTLLMNSCLKRLIVCKRTSGPKARPFLGNMS